MTRSTWCTLTLLATLIGCSGDKLLGPPDAPACTRGALVAGASVTGTLNRSDCPVFSEWEYAPEYYESWTMPVQAGHAYLVHLAPDSGAAGDSLDATLLLYARNSGNDPALSAAGAPFAVAPLNLVGMQAQDLFFVAPEDAAIALRIETTGNGTNDTLHTGSYVLHATECPSLSLVANDSASAPIKATASACVIHRDADSIRVSAFPFTGGASHQYTASMIIDSGAVLGEISLGGPSWDLLCDVRFDCIYNDTTGTDSLATTALPETAGLYEAYTSIVMNGGTGGFHLRLHDSGPPAVAPFQPTRSSRRAAR
ncbi:MAG: hypothetical protein WBC97_06540 [Gemmatimonadales bacterium]